MILVGCSSSNERAHNVHRNPVGHAESAHAGWLHEIRSREHLAPQIHYYNFPRTVLWARLQLLAIHNGFTVDKVHLVRLSPGQAAPEVYISAPNPKRISLEIQRIMNQVDPIYRRALPNGTHVRWEGFYFQVNDEHGSPAFGTYVARRGKNWAGGQFASNDALLPYLHG